MSRSRKHVREVDSNWDYVEAQIQGDGELAALQGSSRYMVPYPAGKAWGHLRDAWLEGFDSARVERHARIHYGTIR